MSGHDDEFSTFVRESGGRLHRAALLLTGDHHRAEDLTQATYARAYVHWRKVVRAESPMAYAHTTLLNIFLSQQRLRRSGEHPARRDDVATLAADRGVPSASVGVEERLDLLAALGTLAPVDRAIVVLRYWEDHSVAETARALDLTETTVRTRAHRALLRLRPLLQTTTGRTPS